MTDKATRTTSGQQRVDEEDTNPGGTDPPRRVSLVDEVTTALSALLDARFTTITDAITTAAQVHEQLGRFNANFEELRHELRLTRERVTVLEARVGKLESSTPPNEAA